MQLATANISDMDPEDGIELGLKLKWRRNGAPDFVFVI